MNLSIQKLINEELRRKDQERASRDQTTWHASRLGSCLCGTYLARLGVKPDVEIDDRLLRVFDLGNKIEDWIIDLISKQNQYEIKTQERLLDESLNLSGYYDLYIKDKETQEEEIVEVKSKNSQAFWYMEKKGEGAQIHHKMQNWSYLYMTGIERGRIIYVSKDDQCILEYPIFLEDEKLRTQVLDQLSILREAWEKKIPPKPAPKGSWQEKYCNHHKQCLKQEKYLERDPLFYKDLLISKVVNNNKKSITI